MNTITVNSEEEAIKIINEHRKQNKDRWIFLEIQLPKFTLKIKSYNTYLQICKRDDTQISFGGNMNNSVKQFNEELKTAIYYK